VTYAAKRGWRQLGSLLSASLGLLCDGGRRRMHIEEGLEIARQKAPPFRQVARRPFSAVDTLLNAPDIACEDSGGVGGCVLCLEWQVSVAQYLA